MAPSDITSVAQFGELPIFFYFTGDQFKMKNLFVDDEVNIIVFWNVLNEGSEDLIQFVNEMADKYYHLPLNFISIHGHGVDMERNSDVGKLLDKEEDALEAYTEYFLETTMLDLFYMEPFETGVVRNKLEFPGIIVTLKDELIGRFYGENYKEQMEMFLQGFSGYYTYQNTPPTVAYENLVP